MTSKSSAQKKVLKLTSPRKMGAAKKGKKATTGEALREALTVSIEQVTAGVPGLDSDQAVDQKSIGEVVQPVAAPTRAIAVTTADGKVRTAKAQARRPAKKVKAEAETPAVEPAPKTDHGPALLALLTRDTGATVAEMLAGKVINRAVKQPGV